MVKGDPYKTLFESGGDATSKSTIGTTTKTLGEKSEELRQKNYTNVDWTLIYDEEEGKLLIRAKNEGEGKLQVGKTFNYSFICRFDYEDQDSSKIVFDVDSSVGERKVMLDEKIFVIDSCHPKALKKDVQTKNNLIVALRPYIKGELVVSQTTTPPRPTKKSKQEQKAYHFISGLPCFPFF